MRNFLSYIIMLVVEMKVWIITKKKLWIISIFLFLIIMIGTFSWMGKEPIVLATEWNQNSVTSSGFQEKIQELMKQEEKIAYLTFDDGPNPLVTPKVLDILKEKQVKATFFVIGKQVEAYPEIVKRAYEEGHYIANHGYDHKNRILYQSKESFINEITKTDEAVGKAIGEENYSAKVFRFPNGYMSKQNKAQKEEARNLLRSMNYAYIDWNCLNQDSMKKQTKTQLLENLKKSCKNKNTLVVLMHDTKDVSDSSTVLADSIDYLKEEGYEFKNFYDV